MTCKKIINRIKDLDDLEFETCMASLPYEEFQTEEEIKKERENLIIKDKQKAFITQYGIVDEGDIVDEEDLHEYMDTENTMEE